MLRRLDRHDLARALLDLPKMRLVLQSIQAGPTEENTGDAVTTLLRGLGVGMFLLRFP